MNTSVPTSVPTNQSVWGNVSTGLDALISGWARVEQIKAAKASTGQGRVEQAMTPELDNGAAVVVEAPKKAAQPSETLVFGVPQKTLLLGFGGLLVLGLVMRGNK
ncbi:virion structural protein [Pseudoalteromonas phage PM2]|uniref:Protein P3 n=1 Tax=Pseudoalteromonas phage PM2 TaxID=2905728 RepID=P3_BPPM2|nr:virion structural protein [Pseudoalteromonas phage PM2]Q9XJR6.1 RecName: Full=Protein P3; AltName: Full=Protein III [Pseudoalteromonas phage PM2]2W0C_P Chain P, Protein P3 [Pseudoalteromonas phage PM2]2W0C_Q Chain Q, Protein P3 [Pseudoalteromonas phage PM2]2W0C_R Chain R, Protein P3 [Pseudoalteromonas phage PM2]2W0C_S Chain S, Protein P3 [Pseudoalteromonas phage PM2]AAD43550.1 structural protein P3 [Pseudoalteromonas phage PM2]|tara:strand:+ start:787 stop:1101 length:315 start_codon:yes stop_codon:yes gene_type:complete